MREILFRGKRVIDGKWVESCCPLGEMHSGTVTYDFDSETVCQYTGLTDKNGRKIFEGDIISFCHSKIAEEQDERNFMPDYEEYTRNYAVEFVNTYCTYGLRARNKSIHFKLSQATINTHNAKIIGNIFDNLEMINGGDISERSRV